jgi:hypothetical protein
VCGVIVFAVITLVGVVAQRQSLALSAPSKNASIDRPIVPPKLGTQVAKESFQGALDELSKIVGQTDGLLKISNQISGSRPLFLELTQTSAVPLESVRQLDKLASGVDDQLFHGGKNPFFNQRLPSHRDSLLSIMPEQSQEIWQDYRSALYKLTLAIIAIQNAEKFKKEDIDAYHLAVKNAELRADEFQKPTSAVNDWLIATRQRIDRMASTI